MDARWFGDLGGGRQLGATLPRLVEAVSRMLDGLASPAVTQGSCLVDPVASAVVLPSASLPGCGLVVQVAEWSSSVGCWWSAGTDPRPGPVAPELFAEFPLRPDGVGQAVAWLERELRRPVLERERRYGLARRRRWSLVLDDGRELAVRGRWLPGWGAAGEGTTAAGALRAPAPGARLLAAAGAAAAACWVLAAATPALFWAPWAGGAIRVLNLAAFALLLAWFRVAGRDRPARVRVPLLAGLVLAMLGQLVVLLAEPVGWPSPDAPAPQALGLLLRGSVPSLLGVAALACWLAAILGLPGQGGLPPALGVVAGVGWGLDTMVGLWWLVAPPWPAEDYLTWYGLPDALLRAAALGLAIVLLLAVADRGPAMDRRAARAGLAGGVLLVVVQSVALQAGVGALTALLPQVPAFAFVGASTMVAWFAGAALVAVAVATAAGPQASASDEASPSPSVAAASRRNPSARPNWGE
jgi:hypothetical protein